MTQRKTKHGWPAIPAESISGPGCYVCNWNGHLLRLTGDAYGQAFEVSIVGDAPLFVTKISDNPYLRLSDARELARGIIGLSTSKPKSRNGTVAGRRTARKPLAKRKPKKAVRKRRPGKKVAARAARRTAAR